MAETILIVFTLLFVKHFIFDFLYQPPYQWKNKGTYGHPGGLIHAGQHAIPTFLILLPFGVGWELAFAIAALEFLIHYHVDWAKMNLNARMGWGATTHEQFWQLLGLDQLLHYLTYSLIIYLAFI